MAASVFLALGIALGAFSIQESHAEEIILGLWNNIWPPTLNPQGTGPVWGLELQEGSFFDLNVSTSDAVRLRIGTPAFNNDTGEQLLTNLLFNEVGTHFTEKVVVSRNGSYEVEIANEGSVPVDIWGNASARKILETYQTVYPYSLSGTLVALGSFFGLVYGILTHPKKRHATRNSRKFTVRPVKRAFLGLRVRKNTHPGLLVRAVFSRTEILL